VTGRLVSGITSTTPGPAMTCFALPSWRRGAIERELRVFVRTTKAIRKYRTLTVAVTQVIEPLLMRGNITQDLSWVGCEGGWRNAGVWLTMYVR